MLSLLLIDDERLELETLRDYIDWNSMGIDRVYTAGGGREGYDKVHKLRPDVVITDIEMPGINGLEMAKMLYEDQCPTKIIFLTGYDEFEYAKTALQVHAIDYILKPFTQEKVRETVERAREAIRKERLFETSMDSMERELIVKMVLSEPENAQEACREYRNLKKEENNPGFGVLKLPGRVEKKIVMQAEQQLSEIQYMIFQEKADTFYVLTYDFVQFRDTAQRLKNWFEKQGILVSVLWYEEKVPVEKLPEVISRMNRLNEQLHFLSAGNLVSVSEAEKIAIMESEEENKRVHEQILEKIRKEISLQNSENLWEEISRKAEGYFDEIGREHRKYIYIQEEAAFLVERIFKLCMRKDEKQVLQKRHQIVESVYQAENVEEVQKLTGEAIKFVKEYGENEMEIDKNKHITEKVRRYVEKNYGHAISIEKMAEEIGLSPNYVRHIFKEQEGITLNNWITEFRLEKACELLQSTDYSIKEISRMTGYESNSYFCAVFAKHMKISPDGWRRKNLR